MWQLDNRTRYAAERAWVRDRDGAELWLVAVKCTFDVDLDGATALAPDQPAPTVAPLWLNPAAPARSSLLLDADLVRTKVATDVVLLGHACAPHGRPVTQMEVGLRVGTVVKQLHVTGNRVWRAGVASAPEAFVLMPLAYERAFGGFDPASRNGAQPQWDVRNPAGTGYALSNAGSEQLALPNIEYPGKLVKSPGDRPAPAGLSPIPVHWQPRAAWAGTYDQAWQNDRFPLLPQDFDDRHYQSAPPDQQAQGFLRGGEDVVLLNLTPTGDLRFVLPRVALGLETFFNDGERWLHEPPRLHTVILEADFPRVSMVWHSALRCHHRVHKLVKTRIIGKHIVRLGTGAELLETEGA